MTATLVLPPPFRLIDYDVIDSTNDEARRLAAAGEGHGLVVRAAEQSAGRGRRGRAWVSPRGNLHCSFLLEPGRPLSEAAQLGFVAGLALVEALAALLPGASLRCKWPNDVLLDGRKIAGMLLETTGQGTDDGIVLGLGVNVAHSPDPALYQTAALRRAGYEGDDAAVLAAFCAHLGPWYQTWRQGGFGAIRPAWLARAHGLGGPATVRLAAETIEGSFADLDQDGALLLDLPGGGRRRVLAGDIYFPG